MSLLLRKACQDILEQFGLGAYHVDLNSSKSLSIVAECGKPLVSIHGIRFNRVIPNQVEIDFAAELLDNFMGTHNNLLQDYLKKEAAFKKFKLPDSEVYEAEVGNSHVRHKGYVKTGTVSYDEGIFNHVLTYFFEEDKHVLKTSINEDKLEDNFSIDSLTKAKCDKPLFTGAKKYLGKWLEKDTMEDELSNLLNQVNQCDI